MRPPVVQALTLALALALTACSAESPRAEDAAGSIDRRGPAPSGVESSERPGEAPGEAPSAPVRLGTRPDPVPGVVTIDGTGEALTEPAVAGFAATGTDVRVTQETGGETRAFERLCVGEVDVVDSARPLTADEYAVCRANGLDVVQLRVAADAVVLAIRHGSDVGTDCLSTDQLRTAFEAGSAVETWSQLGDGLDDVPFVAAGPAAGLDVARSFGRDVLGVAEPVGSDFRAGYRAGATEVATRTTVSGFAADSTLVSSLAILAPQVVALEARLAQAWAAWADAGDRAARRAAFVAVQRVRARLAPLDSRRRQAQAAQQRLEARDGVVGLFSHGYLAAHPRALRPLEIEVAADDDGDDDRRGCVLPDAPTVLDGSYPLSRSLLLTVSTRSLGRPEVRGLLRHHLANARSLAARVGVVPLPAAEVERQLAWLDTGSFPRFGIGADDELAALPDEVEVEERTVPEVETPAR